MKVFNKAGIIIIIYSTNMICLEHTSTYIQIFDLRGLNSLTVDSHKRTEGDIK